MAYTKPTLSDLTKKCREYFNTHLPNVDAFLFPSFVFVLTKVIALMIYPLYIMLDYYLKQTFAHLADKENLLKHGAERGLSKGLATKAKGTVTITVTGATTINAGSFCQRSDGLRYVFDATTNLSTGTTSVNITAEFDGATYNLATGATLTLSSSNPLVSNIVAINSGIIGGSNTESIESFRERILNDIRSLKISGTKESVTNLIKNTKNGVTRVFFDYPTSIEYEVYFMMDETYSNGIPNAGDIAEVQTIIDDLEIGLHPIAKAPTLQTINISVNCFVPITDAQRESARLEIEDYLTIESDLSTTDNPFSVIKEGLDQAVARGLGTASFTMTSPTSNVAIASGKLPALGTLTITVV